ncbi:hypothetical protein ACPW96_16775 [Micromonospora sp. DT81.3]|uniref:hypothetical protein n=1 Tax=Micromonospora sp. DT81.3 TaxID=3416523 RepID=UPI003CE6A95B
MADRNNPATPEVPRALGASTGAKKDWSHEDRVEWVQLSYEAGLETLKAQREELNGMRTRALAFVAFSATATAFLVGAGLGSGVTRDAAFFVLTGLGTLCFALLAVLLVSAVVPWVRFQFILIPSDLMDWMEGNKPAPDRLIALRRLATHTVPEMISANEVGLSKIRRRYRATLIVALLTLAIWVSVVWVFS